MMVKLVLSLLLVVCNVHRIYCKSGFGTNAVHAGADVDVDTGSILPSINLGTTFAQHEPGLRPGKDNMNSFGQGFFYSRFANPSRGALERALAASENSKYAFAFSSGMAAISTIIQLLKSGDHVLALDGDHHYHYHYHYHYHHHSCQHHYHHSLSVIIIITSSLLYIIRSDHHHHHHHNRFIRGDINIFS